MTFIIKPIRSRPRRRRQFPALPKFPKFKFRTRRPKNIRRLIGPLMVVGIFIFLGGAISLAMLTAWVSRDLPNPNTLLDRALAQSTTIYDRTGEHILYNIHGDESRTIVKLDDLPPYVAQATIAIEDKNFYEHRGFVLTSVVRAALSNLLSRDRGQGGSTITQQFIKNAVLSPEKKYTRKIKELLLSIEIERRFTKDQILQMYFNEIPYGRTNYGIEAASQNYFHKSATELTLAEAATLAAIPQASTYYLNNPDQLLARRNLVLGLMVDQGYLNKEEATRVQNQPLGIEQRIANIEAPHFVLWVKEMLTEKYGERIVEQGGLRVITTLDYDKQKAAEEAVANGIEKIEANGGSNAALVAIDPKNGNILAMVGSRDYFNEEYDGAVNVVLRPRQPGSSFKPVVYAAGFMKGYTPTTILYDAVTTFKNLPDDYEPHNYDLKERGPVTVRTALQGSLNIPAVKMIYLAGIENVLDLADALGYTTLNDRSRFGLSLVLGGGEVKLLEHVAAYGTFANDGIHQEPIAILRVEDARGAVLEEWRERDGTEVMEPQYARMITDVLQDNEARTYIFGAANHLTLSGRPAAAKTGTTNDYHDAWTIGYTPSLAAGVWAGNNNNKEMSRGADGSVIAAPIWQAFMTKALEGTGPETFIPPKPIVTGKPVLDGQIQGTVRLRVDRATGLLATENTPENWIEERTFAAAHSILYHIDKDDPQGDAQGNPNDDQYDRWESAIARWANEQDSASGFAPAPTRYDDAHTEANKPRIDIDEVGVDGGVINVRMNVFAPRGVTRVTYDLDGRHIASRIGTPLDGAITLPDWASSGTHTLTITAYDDVDNKKSVDQNINW